MSSETITLPSLLTITKEAVDFIRPMIERLLSEKAKRQCIHILVLRPDVYSCHVFDSKKSQTFDAAIMYEESIGDFSKAEKDYAAIARSKAEVAFYSKSVIANGLVAVNPMLLVSDLMKAATPFLGAFNLNGLIVAASGVEPEFDQLVSAWAAYTINQLTQNYITKAQTKNPDRCFIHFYQEGEQ